MNTSEARVRFERNRKHSELENNERFSQRVANGKTVKLPAKLKGENTSET